MWLSSTMAPPVSIVSWCTLVVVSFAAQQISTNFPFSTHQGSWYYDPPEEGALQLGRYTYVSPMAKTCLQNLTVFISNAICQEGYVSEKYHDDLLCAPALLEMQAAMVDRWNANTGVLKDTCLQLSSSHYPFYTTADFGGRIGDAWEALNRGPAIHGMIGFQIMTDLGPIATAAGIPYVEIGTSPSVLQDIGKPSEYQFQTTYRVRSDVSLTFPGVVKALLPKRFAVLLEERTATQMGAALEDAVARTDRVIAFSAVVPENRQSGKRTDAAMKLFVQELIQKQLRYVLVLAPYYGIVASLVCALWRADAHKFVQIQFFGNGNDPMLAWMETECASDPSATSSTLIKLMEETGIISVMPNGYLHVDHDLRVNLNTGGQGRTDPGAIDLMGDAWAMPSVHIPSFAMAMYNLSIPGCLQDDDVGINSSLAVRAALMLKSGEGIDCSNYTVMALGQGAFESYVKDVAKFCPVSSCQYNPLSSACRISTCCPFVSTLLEAAMNMTSYPGLGGGPVCTTWAGLPQLIMPQLQKCEGISCRPMAFGPSAMAATYNGYLFAALGFCQPPCERHPIMELVYLGISSPCSDALYALGLAYACIEQKHGTAGLERLAKMKNYKDTWIASELNWCMENSVEFDGILGKINFKAFHSPEAGYTVNVLSQPHSTVGAVVMAGWVTKDSAVVTDRVFSREDFTKCNTSSSFMAPSQVCPEGTTVEFKLGVGLTGTARRLQSDEQMFPLGSPQSCPAGEYPLPYGKGAGIKDVFSCVPCPAGTAKAGAGEELCLPCALGLFSAAGQSECTLCPENTFSKTPEAEEALLDGRVQRFGPSECLPCDVSSVSKPGASSCNACMPGTFRNSSLASCKLCEPGRFQPQDGSSECALCDQVLPGSSSPQGASNEAECFCGQGTFMRAGQGCIACLEGMRCPGGSGVPLQKAGHFAKVIDEAEREYSVYLCRNTLQCPEGPPETCASGRDPETIACNNCLVDYHKDGAGTCLKCTDLDRMPFLAILMGMLVFGSIMIVLMKVDLSKQRLTTLTVLMTGGQLVTALQALGAVRSLTIDWQEPVRSFMGLLSLLTLDFDVANTSCLVAQDGPLPKFAMQILTYPFLFTVLLSGFMLSKFTRNPVSVDSFYNLNGTVLFVLFISMTLAMLMPLQCINNPNGTSSVAANPGVVCWQSDEHLAMAVLSFVGIIIYPVAILSWTTWTVLQYPSRVASGTGLMLNIRYRFLFGRFRAECYYFGLFYLCRNTLIALIPVAFANAPVGQVISMGAVLLIALAIQAYLWPWRTMFSNASDLGISICLILVLLGAAPLLHIEDSSILGNLIFGIILALFISGVIVIAHAIYSRFRPPKAFGAFLCHHKAGAGSLCRYMKTVGAKHTSALMFLDSDELESLDLIFDTVRCSTKALVIILTPELLHRMWCAGEIVSAHRNNVFILPILCDGYTHPDDARIEAIPDLWSEEQKHTLMSFGISVEMIKDAYRHVVKLPSLTMPRFGSPEDQERVVTQMIKLCSLPNRAFTRRAESTASAPIIMTGSVNDAEALSTLYVVQAFMQKITQQECRAIKDATAAEQALDSAVYLLVLFSKGMLRDQNFAQVLLTVMEGSELDVEIVTVSADTGFVFPGPEFYKELEMEGLGVPGLGPEVGDRLSKAYRSLLSVLALPLSPLGSEGLIEKQLTEISRRFRKLSDISTKVVRDKDSDARRQTRASIQAWQSAAEKHGKTEEKEEEKVQLLPQEEPLEELLV
eukprot:TRINITY_DN33782_c0_g1_i1.p1 TRINITY_DN33782_c0_g1~~TRINITY_DN33782_c0_g1_i1.p1  ORF type:complete len:1737 (-),score=245.39 TRINITY_DN33782_c0_g1_i1:121-5331(-)